ncbi:hypothetical protein JXA63_00045 [Candidatus Woesebacteria bacterium]|nr:hypothetical protein [Candidatus Woesebacteria bacterium]
MTELTVIFLTTNDVPKKWAEFHKKTLLAAVGKNKLITISNKALDFGNMNLIQKEPRSRSNVYRQLLRGAKHAKTEFIAVAEDDVLYPKEHFDFRPPCDNFFYNNCHWSLFTWNKPVYHWNDRMGNYSLVASRNLVIKTLEKIFRKFPGGIPEEKTGELGRAQTIRSQGIRQKLANKFYTTVPLVVFHHDRGFDELAKRKRKRMGLLRAYDIPYWGPASKLVKKWGWAH